MDPERPSAIAIGVPSRARHRLRSLWNQARIRALARAREKRSNFVVPLLLGMDAHSYLIRDTLHASRAIINAVSRGHDRHTSGLVPLERAEALVTKFAERYGVLESASEARQRRRHKLARARLHMGFVGRVEDGRLWWLLLVSREGEGPVTTLEKLYAAQDKHHRIHIMGLELVRYPRLGSVERWTWRLPTDAYRLLLKHAVALAQHQDPRQAQALINHEMRRPGYRGIRTQRKELFRAMARARVPLVKHGAAPLVFPESQFWLRMLSADMESIPLGVLVRRLLR